MTIRLTTLLLAILLAGLLSFMGGAWVAYERGQSDCQATHDRSDLQLATQLLQSASQDMRQANADDLALRDRLSQKMGLDAKTTKELRDDLKKTAASRAGCRFSDNSMQLIENARERSAKAAASGIDGALPAAGGSSVQRP